jgi:hypothetical protein
VAAAQEHLRRHRLVVDAQQRDGSLPARGRSPISRRAKAASSTSHNSAVPCSPFQLAASSARKISNAARTASGSVSLASARLPSAESRFQSCRSFLRVEPEFFRPAARVT